EAARDEWIVQCADRKQPLAVDRMRQAERGEQDKQVVLGDSKLDVLTLRGEFPVERGRDAFALEHVGHFLACEQIATVHPWTEVGRDGYVRRGGDDALDEIRVAASQLVEQRAKSELGRH